MLENQNLKSIAKQQEGVGRENLNNNLKVRREIVRIIKQQEEGVSRKNLNNNLKVRRKI